MTDKLGDDASLGSHGSWQQVGDDGPLSLDEDVILKAIYELPEASGLEVSTSLDAWRDKKVDADEFVSFLQVYAEQSPTLARVLQGQAESSSFSDSTGGGLQTTACVDAESASAQCRDTCTAVAAAKESSKGLAPDENKGSSSFAERDSNSLRNSSDSSPQNANGSSPQTTGSDSDKGCDKGYMGSASESNGHSSQFNGGESSSNGCETSSQSNGNASSSRGHSSRESGSGSGSGSCEGSGSGGEGSGSGEQSCGGSDSGGKENSPAYNSPNDEVVQGNPLLKPADASASVKVRKRQASSNFSDTDGKAVKVEPGADSSAVGGDGTASAAAVNRRSGGSHAHTHVHVNKRSRHSNASAVGSGVGSVAISGNSNGQPRGPRGGSGSASGTSKGRQESEMGTTESCENYSSSATNSRPPKGSAGCSGSGCGGGFAGEFARHGRDPGYGAAAKLSGGLSSAESDVAMSYADDHRWVPGMTMDDEGVPSISAQTDDAHHYRWSSQLARTDLGELLTAKANMALGSSSSVTVREVSKVMRNVHVARSDSSASGAAGKASRSAGVRAAGSGGSGETSTMPANYIRKALLTFQCINGADVLIMGMYVQQFGPESSPIHRDGHVLIECIDSPPVWPSFAGAARKNILTAVVLGYIEWAASCGFKFLHLYVPPLQDSTNYILVKRSLNFRLRVTIHLSYWFKQLLDQAMTLGSVTDYHCTSNHSDIDLPPGAFDSCDLSYCANACTHPGGDGLMSEGVGSSAWQRKHMCFSQKFFLSILASNALSSPSRINSQLMPNKVCEDRVDFSKFIKDKGLHFHTLAHAQYATMVLVHAIAVEQRANDIKDCFSTSPDEVLARTRKGVGSHLDSANSPHMAREHYNPSLHVPSSICGGVEGDDADYETNYRPYRMHYAPDPAMAAGAHALRRGSWNACSMLGRRGVVTVGGDAGHVIRGHMGGSMPAVPPSPLYSRMPQEMEADAMRIMGKDGRGVSSAVPHAWGQTYPEMLQGQYLLSACAEPGWGGRVVMNRGGEEEVLHARGVAYSGLLPGHAQYPVLPARGRGRGVPADGRDNTRRMAPPTSARKQRGQQGKMSASGKPWQKQSGKDSNQSGDQSCKKASSSAGAGGEDLEADMRPQEDSVGGEDMDFDKIPSVQAPVGIEEVDAHEWP